MMQRRTYWHLEQLGRKPSDYEITTSQLLYYPARGFALKLPIERFYQTHQRGSTLRSADWEAFVDPRATTYTRYVALMREKEVYVEGLLNSFDEVYDRALLPEWLVRLEELLPVLRFPSHGLQMLAAYVGQMAPSGRLVVTGAFQAADELRRVQVFAYRLRQLQLVRHGFGENSRRVWQSDPSWQALRALIERLLVTYDFGEALVALNLVVKPLYDELFCKRFGELALAFGDRLLERVLFSLYEDGVWQREWSQALFRMLLIERPENRTVVQRWVGRHYPATLEALSKTAPLFDLSPAALVSGLEQSSRSYLEALEVRTP
jgi:toluene monooxygenase system protein E